jgi:AcrR family transcriptional regulator
LGPFGAALKKMAGRPAMGARPKTSGAGIRAVARRLLEEEGIERLSMQAVGEAVGVRAPSLYKRFANKSDLLRAVTRDALLELQGSLEKAARRGSAYQGLKRMAAAYRAFAKKNPRTYQLIFAGSAAWDDDLDARRAAAATLLRILSKTMGAEKALLGARTLVAFLHGFLLMELNGLFRFGGNVNAAFKFGLSTILDSLLGQGVGAKRDE